MSTLQERAAEFRAKAAQIRASLGEVAEVIFLRRPEVQSTLTQAEAEASTAHESKRAERELARARKCGPELARLVELRQRGRALEADIFEQAQAYALRDQRAKLERLNAEHGDQDDPELSVVPEIDQPEPPTAA